jgi:hypothetical protein
MSVEEEIVWLRVLVQFMRENVTLRVTAPR